MENKYSNKSLLEIAYELVEESVDGLEIDELLNRTLEAKGIDVSDAEARASLYINICSSSKFVYLTTGKWDLKIRHSLEEFDKDGSELNKAETVEEDIEDIEEIDDEDDEDESDDDYDDSDEDEDDEDSDEDDDDEDDEEEESPYVDETEDSYSDSSDDDDYINDDDEDLRRYNDIMDEYEDKYDK